MRYIFSCLLIVTLAFGLVISEASAKRFGGGRSFGVQRSHSSLFSSPGYNKTKSFASHSKSRKWGGVLGGLLVGGLLASLFMGHGFGSGLLSWLVIGAIIYMIMAVMRRMRQPSVQTNASNAFSQHFSNVKNTFTNYAANTHSMDAEEDNDFIPEEFLRAAKVTFMRLQAAYDQQNKNDLRTFTAPEVFAEIEMQLNERGGSQNITEVISLEAQLLNVAKQVDSVIASVRFTGSIKENGTAATLDEIWHFRQFVGSTNWVVGGIQQEVREL